MAFIARKTETVRRRLRLAEITPFCLKCGSEKSRLVKVLHSVEAIDYLELVYLVTALVPSLTACLANSPGNSRRTAVWISRLVMVERLL